ncbi:MAG: zinc ribbon domain-containing protein [Pelolinea sp.]|nr:zinc ribbon domain-containing protein [Pelolinea sp.]
MTQKIFHGSFSPGDLASILLIHFNRGNLEVRKVSSDERVIVQIRSKDFAKSGGQTAIGVTLQQYDDGVVVAVGEQQWLGIAASLGFSALTAIKNPMNLLHRIDDIAQDLEYLSLEDEIWNVLTTNIKVIGNGFQLSEKLKRLMCDYCQTANLVGAPSCLACGAPLGNLQPVTCKKCGYILNRSDKKCPNCHSKV